MIRQYVPPEAAGQARSGAAERLHGEFARNDRAELDIIAAEDAAR